jgi:hypothetical protein
MFSVKKIIVKKSSILSEEAAVRIMTVCAGVLQVEGNSVVMER